MHSHPPDMHAHTGRGCAVKKSAEEEEGKNHISVTAGETDLYLFPQLSYALALLAFHSFSLAWGRKPHQLMFSFTVIG